MNRIHRLIDAQLFIMEQQDHVILHYSHHGQ